MAPFYAPCSALTALLLLLHLCSAWELQEIRPGKQRSRSRLMKRDMSGLDLRSVETFLWGDTDNSETTLGNLTIYRPADEENVLSMERFDGMLESIECTANGMKLTFEDDQTFAYAQRVWDWVNGAENHTFLMVAGNGDCGNNTRRIPYLIHSIAYDEDLNMARLNGTTGEWKDLARSYELQVGSVAMPGEVGLQKRDITQDIGLNLATEFPFKVQVQKGPITGELTCDACNTAGEINFEFRLTQNVVGIPDGARLRMTPRGVKAQAKLKLKVASNFGSKRELWKETVASIPLRAINIRDIVEIGPFLDIDVGGEITGLESAIEVTAGATATLPDSAILQADLFNPSDNEFSGWQPSIDSEPLSIQAQASATFQMFVMPAPRLRVEALGKGVQAGFELKMPFVEVKLEGKAASNGGVCGDPKKTLGVEVKPAFGFEIAFAAGKSDNDPSRQFNVTLGTKTFDLEGFCRGSNPDGENPPPATTSRSPSVRSVTTENSRATPPPGGPPPTSSICTVRPSRQIGECISTDSCESLGGDSTPGLCPGNKDIQCCTYGACNVEGVAGLCQSTSSCAGTSTPGFCKGGDDIQCCTTG